MVKNLIKIILGTFSIVSCCYTGLRSEYGLPRKSIEGYKNTYNDIIDTMAVYYSYASFSSNYYQLSSENTYPYNAYSKFYSNGKVGLFIIEKETPIEQYIFDSKKAKMGYYEVDSVGNIKIKRLTIGDCTLYISESFGFVRGDSIILYRKSHPQHGEVLKKIKLPKENIEEQYPDW